MKRNNEITHDNRVNMSLIGNTTCTKDIIPSIEVWSLFQRKDFSLKDANSRLCALKGENTLANHKLVYNRIEKVCEYFIQTHPNLTATIVVPSTNQLNKYLFEELIRGNKGAMILDNVFVRMTCEEVDDFIWEDNSAFRKKYGDKFEWYYEMFLRFCSKMIDGVFRYHLIKDMEMRKAIDHTIKSEDKFYGKYMSAINGKDILIVDESAITAKSIREAYHIIADCYEPKSITVLTLLSPRYNENGKNKQANLWHY